MKQDDINKLISLLLAIYNYAKDIHYNCPGESFYSNHLLADALKHIQKINGTSKADENLLGAIAQDIQNNLGLLNIMFGD